MAVSTRAGNRHVPGAVFLTCGIACLGAGVATGNTGFHAIGPIFIALGAALSARSRRSP